MFDSRKHSFADYIDCRNLEHEAYELLNQKSFEQALEVIQEALQINPEDDRCCFMEGLIYATMSKEVDFSYIEGARISFDKALALNPDVEAYKIARSSCLFEMAKYYYSSSDPSKNSLALSFINDYLTAIEDKSSLEYSGGLNLKGLIYQEMARNHQSYENKVNFYNQSLEYMDRALRISPADEIFKQNKEYSLMEIIDVLCILNEYKKASNRIGEYLYLTKDKKNKTSEDEMDYASYSNLQACISLETDPSNFDLWHFRNYYDYKEEFDRIDKYLPKSREGNIYASFMNLKAILLQDYAEYLQAFNYYDEALRVWPNNSIQKNKEDCINEYEKYLSGCSDLNDIVIERFDKYLLSIDNKKSKDYASLLNIRGLIFIKREQYAESIEYFNKALKIWPDNEQFLINKKECLYDWANYLFHDLEEYRQATEKINEYLAICENRYDDDYYDAFRFRNKILYDWAVKLFISNEYDESFKMVNDILLINENEKNIDYAVTSNLKACIFDRWGQYDEAIKCYDEALKIDPDNPSIINNRQKTMEKLNNLRC